MDSSLAQLRKRFKPPKKKKPIDASTFFESDDDMDTEVLAHELGLDTEIQEVMYKYFGFPENVCSGM